MAVSFCGKRVLLTRTLLNLNQKRFGYIVLVPEIGEDLPDKNPLLKENGLLEFSNVTIEKCVAAIGKQAVDLEKNVKNLEETLEKSEVKDIFNDVIDPLEQYGSPLETTWGLAKTLYLGNSSLMPSKNYIKIHERARRARATKFNSLPIYQAIKDAQIKSSSSFTEEQKRVVNKYVLEAKLNGVEVDKKVKGELNEILDKLAKERAKFKAKVDTATLQFKHEIKDYQIVRDFPSEILRTIARDPSLPTKGPWQITLQPHIVKSFLEYCPDQTLRWNIWQAENRRASGYAEKSLENSTHIEEIRFLRRNQAKILGYDNYVAMSMETKMAGSVENVRNMIRSLVEKAKPAQEAEIKSLQKFAAGGGFDKPLELHDIPYWKRKQLKTTYQYDDEVLREYFPLPKVLNGLIELVERLFHVKIVERTGIDTWHEDVRYFDIFEDDKPVAGFYLDLYTREEAKLRLQENSGWTIGIRNRSTLTKTSPLMALIFNFQAPLYGKPSLLTFKDVNMLFQKFGYALQHLLTRADYSEVAGVSNVEWDAVQIGSHVMSHFLYDPNTLKAISSHYVSEDSLSDVLLNAIQAQRTHFAGYDLCHELYLANLDLDLYTSKEFWLEIVRNLWPQYISIPLDKKDSHPCSWTPIFSGDWAAAYFSGVWSRLVAADVYSAFYEKKNNEQEYLQIGKRYKDTFLALGGSCNPGEVFRRFRGRDPSPKALIGALQLNKLKVTPSEEKQK